MTSIAPPAACPASHGPGGPARAMEHQFRAVMRAFTGVVTVVTACSDEGDWRGMAATSVTSVSMEPPTCLVCINREASLYRTVIDSRRFCINAMHQDHHVLMPSFTSSGHRDGRFQSGQWRRGRDGVPFLENAQANIFCELFDHLMVGTHDIIIGRVVEVSSRQDRDPLLYGDGTYLKQVMR